MKKEIKVEIHTESFAVGVCRDGLTFGMLIGLFWVNHNYLGDSFSVAFVGTLILLVGLAGVYRRSGFAKGVFYDPAEAIDYIKSETEPRP